MLNAPRVQMMGIGNVVFGVRTSQQEAHNTVPGIIRTWASSVPHVMFFGEAENQVALQVVPVVRSRPVCNAKWHVRPELNPGTTIPSDPTTCGTLSQEVRSVQVMGYRIRSLAGAAAGGRDGVKQATGSMGYEPRARQVGAGSSVLA